MTTQRSVHVPSLARRRLWRGATALAGGLTVRGEWPEPRPDGRGRILVANHSSHADTAALMAALPYGGKPVFAAAADYWFDVWWRRALVTGLAGAMPVRRSERGAYAALLEAATEAVDAGRTVVVYPEGTRTTDGSLGEFHAGASRLAADLGVEVIPVGLLGTRDVLPKRGSFSPSPMTVRLGAPIAPDRATPEALRSAVRHLLDEGAETPPPSPTGRRVAALVDSRAGLGMAFGWGYTEALSWPVMAEMALVWFPVSSPRRIPAWAAAVVAGSVAGIATNAALARRGHTLPAPLTTARMRATARGHLVSDGPSGIRHQALDGIPVKVYARAAGEARTPLPRLLGWAILARGARMGLSALLIGLLERPLRPWLRRLYGPYLALTSTLFALILRRIVRSWR